MSTQMISHTEGPWQWMLNGGSYSLCTPDRGRLIVMDFVRHGMRGAQPRFAKMFDDQPRGRRGGILIPATEIQGTVYSAIDHPDARLIAAAPMLLQELYNLRFAATLLAGNAAKHGDPIHAAIASASALMAKIDPALGPDGVRI